VDDLAVFVRNVQCSNCGGQTALPDTILEQTIQRQSVWTEAGRQVNFACPGCNTLTRSLVFPGALLALPKGLYRDPDDLGFYLVSLPCENKDCESPAIVLAAVKYDKEPGIVLVEVARHWRNRSAQCPKEHLLKEPLEMGNWLRLPK